MIKYIFIILQISFISAPLAVEQNKNSFMLAPPAVKENKVSFISAPPAVKENKVSFISAPPAVKENKNSSISDKSSRDLKIETQEESAIKQNLSLQIESSFSAIKNNLIQEDHSWTYSIPYMEAEISYPFSKNLLIETELDLSYIKNSWDFDIKEIFIKYKQTLFLPSVLILGYFEYPILKLRSNDYKLSKKTLSEKNLFPKKKADIGAGLKVNVWKSFYLYSSWQIFTGAKQLLSPLNTAKNTWTARMIYEEKNQSISANYLKQSFFSKKLKQAFGLSSDLSYPFDPLLFNLKGEFWKINQWPQNSLSYYLFPSIQWNRLILSFLFGKARYQLGRQISESSEFILKTDFYLTDELFISLEKIQESDTIVKNSSWAVSVKTQFSL